MFSHIIARTQIVVCSIIGAQKETLTLIPANGELEILLDLVIDIGGKDVNE